MEIEEGTRALSESRPTNTALFACSTCPDIPIPPTGLLEPLFRP
jgi:hypothetical protein